MAQRFDVCNGDADGLRAALQWRLHEPALATLQTGLKRKIALLKLQRTGAYVVRVRAPLASPSGADALCGQFGEGGRARAAGIGGLPADDPERFLAVFASTRWGGQAPMRPYDGGDDGGSGRRTRADSTPDSATPLA